VFDNFSELEEPILVNEIDEISGEVVEVKPALPKKKMKKTKENKNHSKVLKIPLVNRLNFQFAVIMTLLIALSIGISGFINYRIERGNVITEAQETNALTAVNLSVQVQSYINNAVNSVKTAVNAIDLTSMSTNDRQVSFVKILNYNLNMKSLYMSDMDGNIMVTTKTMEKTPGEIKKETWFTQASNGFTYISDVYMDETTGLAMITLSQPVENIFEGRVGVVVIDLRMDKFKEVVQSIHAGDTGHAYVIDGVGSLMAHADFEEKVHGQVDVKGVKGVQAVMEAESIDIIQKSSEDGNLDYTVEMFSDIYTDVDGTEVIGGYVKIPKLKWSVVVEQEYDDVLKASKASFNRLIKSMTIFIGLGVVISIMVAKSFTRPILNMVGVAEKIKDGDLTERIDSLSKSELGSLQMALNEMVNSLTELINNINLSSSVIIDLSEDLNDNASERIGNF